MVGFALGTETGGSILGPAGSNGASGMRPTYSRVSRFGCMTLAWSLDKIGPLARSAADLGMILEVISGPDPKDVTAGSTLFKFRPDPGKVAGKRIGIVRHEFDLASTANQAVRARRGGSLSPSLALLLQHYRQETTTMKRAAGLLVMLLLPVTLYAQVCIHDRY